MTTISKALVGAVAAGAMAMVPTSAALAQYRDYDRDRERGISAGDIIAGAVVLGGIAAVAGALGRGGYDDRRDERYYRDGRYGYYNGNPRSAVEQCVNAVRQGARSRGYRDAEVTQVRDVDDTRQGWRVKGNLRVEGDRGYYDRRYDDRRYDYDRYDRYDRGSNTRADAGGFTCWIDRGRVARMDYSGIRGM
ncbi:hypothetical protein [Qipengyuania sediminis]|uniref:hypothetical protein n=1 Tax=Qipengyuania sediminis TaxID=1532023 RepID=UPI0010596F35|nr:hypothetical protein [Qipengyuania sediminis]